MPRFKVTIRKTLEADVYVDAVDADAAQRYAEDNWDDDDVQFENVESLRVNEVDDSASTGNGDELNR